MNKRPRGPIRSTMSWCLRATEHQTAILAFLLAVVEVGLSLRTGLAEDLGIALLGFVLLVEAFVG